MARVSAPGPTCPPCCDGAGGQDLNPVPGVAPRHHLDFALCYLQISLQASCRRGRDARVGFACAEAAFGSASASILEFSVVFWCHLWRAMSCKPVVGLVLLALLAILRPGSAQVTYDLLQLRMRVMGQGELGLGPGCPCRGDGRRPWRETLACTQPCMCTANK